jgi:hypothetical protein
VDGYTLPGQFAAVQRPGASQGDRRPTLFALSSSPYAARRESASLDASIVEVRTWPVRAAENAVNLAELWWFQRCFGARSGCRSNVDGSASEMLTPCP